MGPDGNLYGASRDGGNADMGTIFRVTPGGVFTNIASFTGPNGASPYGTLVVDVQGMELETLEGFGEHLRHFTYLCIELSAKPVYDGEASAAEVINFLALYGFRQRTIVAEHADVVFSKW